MHRQPLLEMLGRYEDAHPEEAPVVEQIRALVESAPNCFERSCRPGHITGSAWVLSHDGSQCLLVHHRKLGRWLQPGGHADGEHRVERVALKEVREESGLEQLQIVQPRHMPLPLDVDVHRIPARLDRAGNLVEDAHEHHDIRFLVQAAAGQQVVTSDESHDVRWFTCEEVVNITDEESVLRMLCKAGPR